MPERNVRSAAQSKSEHPPNDFDESLQHLINLMNNDPSHICQITQTLHKHYTNKQRFNNSKTAYFKIVTSSWRPSCQVWYSWICQPSLLQGPCAWMRATSEGGDSKTTIITTLKDQDYCLALPRSHDYDIGQFRNCRIKEGTSPTLLNILSSKISNGDITRASTTLAQCLHGTRTHDRIIQPNNIRSCSEVASQICIQGTCGTATWIWNNSDIL